MKFRCLLSIILVLDVYLGLGCNGERPADFHYLPPEYSNVKLVLTADTIHFPLDDNTYNNIRSFNLFFDGGVEYVSFYDKQSLSVNIYDVASQTLKKKLLLQECLPGRPLEKHTTTYCKSLDSIYVINNIFLYCLDGKGVLRDSIIFDAGSILAFPGFDKKTPPLFKPPFVFLAAKPYLSTSKYKELKKWKVIFKVNLETKKTELIYSLPEVYFAKKYNAYYFDNGYCINDKGNFVFSFAADTNIYETDLDNYHISYYGKSYFQNSDIPTLDSGEVGDAKEFRKSFLIRDSYDAIYFDSFNRRYLRIAEHKISESEYVEKKYNKDKSVIVFDEHFRIVGESKIDSSLSWNTIFFNRKGELYVRVKAGDEQVLHFVKLHFEGKTYNEQLLMK